MHFQFQSHFALNVNLSFNSSRCIERMDDLRTKWQSLHIRDSGMPAEAQNLLRTWDGSTNDSQSASCVVLYRQYLSSWTLTWSWHVQIINLMKERPSAQSHTYVIYIYTYIYPYLWETFRSKNSQQQKSQEFQNMFIENQVIESLVPLHSPKLVHDLQVMWNALVFGGLVREQIDNPWSTARNFGDDKPSSMMGFNIVHANHIPDKDCEGTVKI